MLPARLEHLRLSDTTLSFLPVPELAAWLRRKPFPLQGTLKRLETGGKLRGSTVPHGPKASDTMLAELAELCREMAIEWIHHPDEAEEPDDGEFPGSDGHESG